MMANWGEFQQNTFLHFKVLDEGAKSVARCASVPAYFRLQSWDVMAELGNPMQLTKCDKKAEPFFNDVMAALQDPNRCALVINWLQTHACELCFYKYGALVIQEALEKACTEQQNALIGSFSGNVVDLMMDFNGNHVLQKSLEVVSGSSKVFKSILDELSPTGKEWSGIIMNKFGCRVAQRVFEHGTDAPKQAIVDAVLANLWECMFHEFANYVVQTIGEHGSAHQTNQILDSCVNLGIPDLCRHQIPSKVLENFMEHGDEKAMQKIGEGLLKCSGAIVRLSRNQWGRHIVKRLLGMKEPQQKLPDNLYAGAMLQLFAGRDDLQAAKKHCKQISRLAKTFYNQH